jgi:hypothetical protein
VLAFLEPALGARDQQFFELAVTLIPIFFLAGAVSSAARVPSGKVWPRQWHVWWVVALSAFVVVEINAELMGIESLVSGSASDFTRYFVLSGLVLAILGSAASLVAPWVRHFYRSGPEFRQHGIGLVICGLIVFGFITYGTYSVYGSFFELADAEIELSEIKDENATLEAIAKDLGVEGYGQFNSETRKTLLRLHIRYAHFCRLKNLRPLLTEEGLSLRLVQTELAELILENGLISKLGKKGSGLSWLDGSC